MTRLADRWSARAWTSEERRALSGLGPAWRLARKATGEVDCPTCGAAVWARCDGAEGLHVDRLFAYAAHLRASTIAPPEADAVSAVAFAIELMEGAVGVGDIIHRAGVGNDAHFDAAIHHGLLRLRMGPDGKGTETIDGKAPQWVLSEYGAACWCAL